MGIKCSCSPKDKKKKSHVDKTAIITNGKSRPLHIKFQTKKITTNYSPISSSSNTTGSGDRLIGNTPMVTIAINTDRILDHSNNISNDDDQVELEILEQDSSKIISRQKLKEALGASKSRVEISEDIREVLDLMEKETHIMNLKKFNVLINITDSDSLYDLPLDITGYKTRFDLEEFPGYDDMHDSIKIPNLQVVNINFEAFLKNKCKQSELLTLSILTWAKNIQILCVLQSNFFEKSEQLNGLFSMLILRTIISSSRNKFVHFLLHDEDKNKNDIVAKIEKKLEHIPNDEDNKTYKENLHTLKNLLGKNADLYTKKEDTNKYLEKVLAFSEHFGSNDRGEWTNDIQECLTQLVNKSLKNYLTQAFNKNLHYISDKRSSTNVLLKYVLDFIDLCINSSECLFLKEPKKKFEEFLKSIASDFQANAQKIVDELDRDSSEEINLKLLEEFKNILITAHAFENVKDSLNIKPEFYYENLEEKFFEKYFKKIEKKFNKNNAIIAREPISDDFQFTNDDHEYLKKIDKIFPNFNLTEEYFQNLIENGEILHDGISSQLTELTFLNNAESSMNNLKILIRIEKSLTAAEKNDAQNDLKVKIQAAKAKFKDKLSEAITITLEKVDKITEPKNIADLKRIIDLLKKKNFLEEINFQAANKLSEINWLVINKLDSKYKIIAGNSDSKMEARTLLLHKDLEVEKAKEKEYISFLLLLECISDQDKYEHKLYMEKLSSLRSEGKKEKEEFLRISNEFFQGVSDADCNFFIEQFKKLKVSGWIHSEKVFKSEGLWVLDKHPIDVAESNLKGSFNHLKINFNKSFNKPKSYWEININLTILLKSENLLGVSKKLNDLIISDDTFEVNLQKKKLELLDWLEDSGNNLNELTLIKIMEARGFFSQVSSIPKQYKSSKIFGSLIKTIDDFENIIENRKIFNECEETLVKHIKKLFEDGEIEKKSLKTYYKTIFAFEFSDLNNSWRKEILSEWVCKFKKLRAKLSNVSSKEDIEETDKEIERYFTRNIDVMLQSLVFETLRQDLVRLSKSLDLSRPRETFKKLQKAEIEDFSDGFFESFPESFKEKFKFFKKERDLLNFNSLSRDSGEKFKEYNIRKYEKLNKLLEAEKFPQFFKESENQFANLNDNLQKTIDKKLLELSNLKDLNHKSIVFKLNRGIWVFEEIRSQCKSNNQHHSLVEKTEKLINTVADLFNRYLEAEVTEIDALWMEKKYNDALEKYSSLELNSKNNEEKKKIQNKLRATVSIYLEKLLVSDEELYTFILKVNEITESQTLVKYENEEDNEEIVLESKRREILQHYSDFVMKTLENKIDNHMNYMKSEFQNKVPAKRSSEIDDITLVENYKLYARFNNDVTSLERTYKRMKRNEIFEDKYKAQISELYKTREWIKAQLEERSRIDKSSDLDGNNKLLCSILEDSETKINNEIFEYMMKEWNLHLDLKIVKKEKILYEKRELLDIDYLLRTLSTDFYIIELVKQNNVQSEYELDKKKSKVEALILQYLKSQSPELKKGNPEFSLNFLKKVIIPLIEERLQLKDSQIKQKRNSFKFLSASSFQQEIEKLVKIYIDQLEVINVDIETCVQEMDIEILEKNWLKMTEWEEVKKLFDNKRALFKKGANLDIGLTSESFAELLEMCLEDMKNEIMLKDEEFSKDLNNKYIKTHFEHTKTLIKQAENFPKFLETLGKFRFFHSKGEAFNEVPQEFLKKVKAYWISRCQKTELNIEKLRDLTEEELNNIQLFDRDSEKFLTAGPTVMMSFDEVIKTKSIIKDLPKRLGSLGEEILRESFGQEKLIDNSDEITKYLVLCEKIKQFIFSLSSEIGVFTRNFLNHLDKTFGFPEKLKSKLRDEASGYGPNIIDIYFPGNRIAQSFSNLKNIDELTKEMRKEDNAMSTTRQNTSLNTDKLKKFYQKLLEEFRKMQAQPKTLENLKDSIKQLCTPNYAWYKPKDHGENLLKIIAHIYLLSSLMKAENSIGNPNARSEFPEPPVTQVLAIFRLLGLGYEIDSADFENIRNNLVQLKGGEGKSMVLGVVSIVFALMDYEVYCACNKKSQIEEFKRVFEFVGVSEKIKFGTFGELCGGHFNEDDEFREKLETLLNGEVRFEKPEQKSKAEKAKKNPKKVLIFEEVDPFFDRSYSGGIYSLLLTVQKSSISKIIRYIWNKKDERLNLDSITKTSEYEELQKDFPKLKGLLDNAIKLMLRDVKDYFYRHEIKDRKIVPAHAGLGQVTNYKKAFLHLHYENEISAPEVENALRLNIVGGYLKSANIFKPILGITETLRELTDEQINFIERPGDDNGFKSKTFLPIDYNYKNNEQFEIYENEDEFHQKICNRVGMALNMNRATIVVFDKLDSIHNFKKRNKKFLQDKNPEILEERTDHNQKLRLLSHAGNMKHLTLATRGMASGSEFLCRDKNVEKNGGILFIQTFFSSKNIEEVRIKDRCKRKGKPGSYLLIVHYETIKNYRIPRNFVTYERLCRIREESENFILKGLQQKDEGIKDKLEKTDSLKKLLNENSQEKIIHILEAFN